MAKTTNLINRHLDLISHSAEKKKRNEEKISNIFFYNIKIDHQSSTELNKMKELTSYGTGFSIVYGTLLMT